MPTLPAPIILYNGLVQLEPDFTLKYYLAEEITPNATATKFTIRVKKGITWHNGKGPDGGRRHLHVSSGSGIRRARTRAQEGSLDVDMNNLRKVDKYTVEVPMHQPFLGSRRCWRTSSISSPRWVTTRSTLSERGLSRLTALSLESRTILPDEDYFEEGLPYVDGLTIIDINDVTARVNAMSTGTVHCVDQLPATAIRSVSSSDVKILRSGCSWISIGDAGEPVAVSGQPREDGDEAHCRPPQMVASALDGYGQVAATTSSGSTTPATTRAFPSFRTSARRRHC